MKKRARRFFAPLLDDFAEHFRGQVEDWRLAELDSLYQEAEGRLLELDAERERRLSEPLELEDVLSPERAERSAAEYAVTPKHAALVAEAVRVARTTSQFEVASPGDVSPALLRSMLDLPHEWPLSAHYAVLAITAAVLAAEWPERADRYLGAAREAVALANAADSADVLEADAPAIATGRAVLAKNRAAAERRGRELRKQGDATREAVKKARDALGAKATAGTIALRVGITRQRAGQILRELKKAES